jgi:hypothetical protein
VLRHSPGHAEGFVADKAVTQAIRSIWNCNPKNFLRLTPRQLAAIHG